MIPGRCLQEWITVLYDNLLTLCTRMVIWSSFLYWICVHLINWIKQILEWYGLGDFRINKNCYKIYYVMVTILQIYFAYNQDYIY